MEGCGELLVPSKRNILRKLPAAMAIEALLIALHSQHNYFGRRNDGRYRRHRGKKPECHGAELTQSPGTRKASTLSISHDAVWCCSEAGK